MRATRSLLLASTVLSGVMAMAHANASAAPLQPEMLAQASPANPAEDSKHHGEKTAPKRPIAPKPPAHPVTPQAHAPQPPHQPAVGAATPHNNKPEGGHVEERTRKEPPKIQPAQAGQVPPSQHPNEKRGPIVQERHAPPEVPGRPGRNERSLSNAPTTPQTIPPHEHAQPAQVTPPATQRNAVTPPGGPEHPNHQGARPAQVTPPTTQRNAVIQPGGSAQPQPSSTVIRRAPPPKGNAAAVPPPTQPINKSQFIEPRGQAPSAGIDQVRAERHEAREGNQLIIHEPDRTIVQEGNRTFIRHNEDDRFAVGARNVHVERHGDGTMTEVWRPDGVEIIDFDDGQGHLLRRVRRDPDGREVVLIDNEFAGPRGETVFLDLPPPVIHVPRDRYIVDADRADEPQIYNVLVAAPVEHIGQRYTLDQVRYNEPLRALMPRLDLEINFDTGSWQLTPDQVDRLSVLAGALNRAIQRNPREVFLIEGYTDAVGSDIDNLSLSDRRAESVAVALTEQFQVPAENLVTQGYGKQFLKVQTDAPERANRRVAIQRITPLIDPEAVGLR